ncbi:hypothetical protein [Frankia sp. R82]|nr:hypothetical protein [Frankia sp. R82]
MAVLVPEGGGGDPDDAGDAGGFESPVPQPVSPAAATAPAAARNR